MSTACYNFTGPKHLASTGYSTALAPRGNVFRHLALAHATLLCQAARAHLWPYPQRVMSAHELTCHQLHAGAVPAELLAAFQNEMRTSFNALCHEFRRHRGDSVRASGIQDTELEALRAALNVKLVPHREGEVSQGR